MKIYAVKLTFWTSPALVQASSQRKAKELALANFPTCDCCNAITKVENVKVHEGATPFYTPIIMEIRK